MSLLGLTKIGYPRGGPPGIFSGALIAITIWRRQKHGHVEAIVSFLSFKSFGIDYSDETKLLFALPYQARINQDMNSIWYFFQPLLFSICFSRISYSTLNWPLVRLGLLCSTISICVSEKRLGVHLRLVFS